MRSPTENERERTEAKAADGVDFGLNLAAGGEIDMTGSESEIRQKLMAKAAVLRRDYLLYLLDHPELLKP